MSAEQKSTIRAALVALGYTRGHVQTEQHHGRAIVYIDGGKVGIWDFGRACFVD